MIHPPATIPIRPPMRFRRIGPGNVPAAAQPWLSEPDSVPTAVCRSVPKAPIRWPCSTATAAFPPRPRVVLAAGGHRSGWWSSGEWRWC